MKRERLPQVAIPADIHNLLRQRREQTGRSIESIVEEWLRLAAKIKRIRLDGNGTTKVKK